MSDFLKTHFLLTHLNFAIGEFDSFNHLCQVTGYIYIMLVNIMSVENFID